MMTSFFKSNPCKAEKSVQAVVQYFEAIQKQADIVKCGLEISGIKEQSPQEYRDDAVRQFNGIKEKYTRAMKEGRPVAIKNKKFLAMVKRWVKEEATEKAAEKASPLRTRNSWLYDDKTTQPELQF